MRAGLCAGCGVVCLAVGWLLPSSALADTTIGFDDLTPGTSVTNQYANAGGQGQGVVFGPLPGGASETAPPVIASAPGQAHSASQVADINCYRYATCPNEGIGTYIPQATGTSAVPRSRVSVYVGLLGAPVPACEAGSTAGACAVVQLIAFDSAGNRIAASAPATVTQGLGLKTQLSVSTASPQIVAFEVTTRSPTDNGKDVAIDDLSFDAPTRPPPPDFTLTPQSTSVALSNGQSASDQITIGRIGGSSGQIQFATGSLPAGVHAEYSPNPAGAQTMLTLTADPDAPSTAQPVTVTGTPASAGQGPGAHSFTLSVAVHSLCADVLTGPELV